MNGICVIGLGSPHGDDQIGWELVHMLERESLAVDDSAELSLRACASVGGEILDLWRDAELAIIVDAVRSAAPPGTLRRLELHPQHDLSVLDTVQALTSHGLDLPDLIELAEALDLLPRRLVLFGVEIAACPPFEPLSAPVRAALPDLMRAVRAEIGVGQSNSPPFRLISSS